MSTVTIKAKSMPRVRRAWVRPLLIALGVLALMVIGTLIAFMPYATENAALKSALEHVESGAIPDEPPAYAAEVAADLKSQTAQVIPQSYASLDTVGGITYNAVLALQATGKYDYALTVGNSRVYKLYKHSGRWWVEGKVLHTIQMTGDLFLTAPAARDRKTPSRERILESSPDKLVLQAQYGRPVTFSKVQ